MSTLAHGNRFVPSCACERLPDCSGVLWNQVDNKSLAQMYSCNGKAWNEIFQDLVVYFYNMTKTM